jgi:hypothetical protein
MIGDNLNSIRYRACGTSRIKILELNTETYYFKRGSNLELTLVNMSIVIYLKIHSILLVKYTYCLMLTVEPLIPP